jgi:hypothetical protein
MNQQLISSSISQYVLRLDSFIHSLTLNSIAKVDKDNDLQGDECDTDHDG